MTTPTDMPIEDRLRAHFADRARTMEIPGPEHDTAVARAREGRLASADGDGRPARRRHPRRGPLLAAAAVVALVALVAGVTMARRDGRNDVSTDPTPAPTVPPTTDPIPDPNRTPATTEAPPTSTTSEPGAPLPTGAIVAREGILGSWDGTSWVRWHLGDPAPSARDYQIVGLDEPIRTLEGSPTTGCGAGGEPTVGFTDEAGLEGIAVAGASDVRPRPVELLDVTAAAYQDAAADVAVAEGIAQPVPAVVQVLRSDLDGDGTSEVLVVAEQRGQPGSPYNEVGDWSVVFERRLVGGAVETTVIDWDLWDGSSDAVPPFIESYRIVAVADLNGDSRMEVALDTYAWESSETAVLAVGTDGTLTEVLTAGCGA